MKLVTKPLTGKDEISKSRHLTGFDRWARSSPTIGFLLLFLEWFTIPFEILFRRDFGQRWLTVINFFAGGFLLVFFTILQLNWHYVTNFINVVEAWSMHLVGLSPDIRKLNDSEKIAVSVMEYFLLLYILFGGYQLFKTKWRNQVNLPLHSFDDGTSRFGWLSAILKAIINFLATPFMIIFWLFLPAKQRRGKPFPKLIYDRDAFTNIFVEPFVAIIFGIVLTGVTSLFFFISGIALFLHAHRKEIARKNKMLDFQDSKLEAEMMKALKNSQDQSKKIVAKAKATIKQKTDKTQIQTFNRYPALSAIIEELNAEMSSATPQIKYSNWSKGSKT